MLILLRRPKQMRGKGRERGVPDEVRSIERRDDWSGLREAVRIYLLPHMVIDLKSWGSHFVSKVCVG